MSIKREILNKTKKEFYEEIKKYQKTLKPTKELSGFPASAIIGEKNYPNLSIHNLQNPILENNYKTTGEQTKKPYEEIIKNKAKNVFATTNPVYIRDVNSRLKENLKDIYKSKNIPEFTSHFEKELKFNAVAFDKTVGVLGSKNELKKININENTKTSTDIERFTSTDIKSKEAIIKLYESGVNEHQIINLLTLGSFGIQINKKLVPTRWGISAYDQTIGNHLYEKIIEYKQINTYEAYYNHNKGNSFLIILLPQNYSFETIEYFDYKKLSDYTNYDNKLHKTEPETAGGFYSTKLAILEHLNMRKKQAGIICIRLIENYELPLGVVLVRESIREAMKNQKFLCGNEKELEEYILEKYSKFYSLYKNSKTAHENKTQKRLKEFM